MVFAAGPSIAVTLMLAQRQHAALSERARAQGMQTSVYAAQLFNAAFTARVADERGEDSGDAALDLAVKRTFLMSDCEPEAIAHVTGFSESAVQRILECWRKVAREGDKAFNRGGQTVAEAPPVPAPSPQAIAIDEVPSSVKRGYSDAEILTIKTLWAEGKSATKIAEALGRPAKPVEMWIHNHRGVCPKRRG